MMIHPEEIRRNNLKIELRQVVLKYKGENCDKFGNIIDNNLILSDTQMKDIKNLKSRIQNEGLTCGQTDKTGKLTLDTLENISKKMDKHIKDDKIIDEKEFRKLESKINRHVEFHKEPVDERVGPDVRPIMGAIVGPNIGLSEIGSRIVRKIADNADIGLVAKSTEEVLNKIEMFNKKRLNNNPTLKRLIIASMDIEKYYPNILSAKSARIIRRMWEESDLSMDGIEFHKVSRYLGNHLKKEEIAEEGFEEILYTRKRKEKKKKKKGIVKKKIGRKHINEKKETHVKGTKDKENVDMDNEEEQNDTSVENKTEMEDRTCKKKNKKTEWIKPVRSPTPEEQRQMFGKALEMMLIVCMDNHVYQFHNKIRVQKQGGPIGLKLTGEIADCLMIDWDKKTTASKIEKVQNEP